MALHTATGTGSPAGVVTPAYLGQHYVDTAANSVYQAYGTTSANWVSLVLNGGVSSSFAHLAENLEISTSRAAGAETIALKTAAGTDSSASDKIRIGFRDATAGTGAYSVLDITAATSIVISSGSTLGASNATAFRLWLVGFNDASTFRLGVIKCALTDGIYGLQDNVLESSTAEGGAGAADSSGVIYTGTAVAAKAMRVLGYLEYTLTTAGTWDAAPSAIQIYSHGDRLPNESVQSRVTYVRTYTLGTGTIPGDNTVPQNTEGTEFITQVTVPRAAVNVLQVEAEAVFSVSADNYLGVALFRDTTAAAFSAIGSGVRSGYHVPVVIVDRVSAASTASTTFKLRAGGNTTAAAINGVAGAQLYGGTMASFLKVTEIMV